MSTPIMEQYKKIKAAHQDYLLFFRLGDFYELFFEDAAVASEILGITLTKRCQKDENIPMAGVPYHASEHYIAKLIQAGKKVAMCEQTELATNKTSKIIDRQVTRIITAGTITDDVLLQNNRNNFLIALHENSAAVFDLSTNQFFVQDYNDNTLKNFLDKINPSEIVITQKFLKNWDEYKIWKNIVTLVQEITFTFAVNKICTFYQIHSKESIGNFSENNIITIAMILNYIEFTQKNNIQHIALPSKNFDQDLLYMDKFTRTNLEIIKTLQNENIGSVLWLLDQTLTAQGARMLFKIINNPITNIEKLNASYEKINDFIQMNLPQIRSHLKTIPDFERLLIKIHMKRISFQELYKLANGMKQMVQLANITNHSIANHDALATTIMQAINLDNKENDSFINHGFDSILDEWKQFEQKIDEQINTLQENYKKELNISTLRIKKVQKVGYLIEVNPNYKEKMNYNFHLVQSLKNANRYITNELNTINFKLQECQEVLRNRESEIFDELCQKIIHQASQINEYANISADIDVFSNFAYFSMQNNYIRPILSNDNVFDVQSGKNPILDYIFKNKAQLFVANNCVLNEKKVILMTGPNMAGKSTYLRQQALIILLAHIGMYVPCSHALIGIVDAIFSRISTNDNLINGNSTFMMEMIEIGLTLNQATNKSFIIFDEIGRGTSSEEGVAIAQAILEYLLEKIQARGIFATHYLSLKNVHHDLLQKKMMQIIEEPMHFTYKIINGSAEKSHALHVALMANIPHAILNRAQEIIELNAQLQ